MSLALLFLRCGKGEEKSSGRNPAGSPGGLWTGGAIPVKVARVRREPISTYILTHTTLEAQRQVDVIARVSGLVEWLGVEEGDKVQEGQVLAKLDDQELVLELERTQAQVENYRRLYERARDMYQKDLISRESFENTKYQYETAKAQYESARLRVEYARIRSPIMGILTRRFIELGGQVTINQKVFTVADYDTLFARIYVPEKEIKKVSIGQKARITVEAFPDQSFWGRVKMISPVVDPASGTVKVTIEIPKRQTELLPGMFASVYIITETHPQALVIPKRALLLESETDRVFVCQEGVARQREVKLGFSDQDRVEVLKGLEEGEQVVIIGQEGLREGARVAIVAEEAVSTTPVAVESPQRPATPGDIQAPAYPGSRQPEEKPSRPPESSLQASRGPQFPPGLDPERFKRFEQMMLRHPEIRKEYEKRLQEDPDFATNVAKKIQFFREMRRKFFKGKRPWKQE